MPPAVDFLGQMLGTGLVLLVALYGSVFDPPENRGLRLTATAVSVLAGAWLIMLMIVAGSARA